MPVPDYQSLMLPVLGLIGEGKQTIPDCLPKLIEEFGLSPEECSQMVPSGRQTYLSNRAHWARTYLAQAGLVRTIKRGTYVLTDEGRALLLENPSRLDKSALLKYPKFQQWLDKSTARRRDDSRAVSPVTEIHETSQDTPEEDIERSFREINLALADDVLARVLDCSPVFFERLIVDLLVAMGYGRGNADMARALGKSGDGGIDGIINEDALGLDAVYIQAKRYQPDSKIGRPAIQQFVGSLTGEGATKGVFVTTSDFSTEARDYVRRVQQRIVLINGAELARLLIAHEIGVRARKTYVLRSVDEDYFIDT